MSMAGAAVEHVSFEFLSNNFLNQNLDFRKRAKKAFFVLDEMCLHGEAKKAFALKIYSFTKLFLMMF